MFEEEMKIRVPVSMKAAFEKLAEKRLTSEAALAREAFLQFLEAHQEELKAVSQYSYRKASRKDTHHKIVEIAKKGVEARRRSAQSHRKSAA